MYISVSSLKVSILVSILDQTNSVRFPWNLDFYLDPLDEIEDTARLTYKYKKVSSVLCRMGDNTMESFCIRDLHDDFELTINGNVNERASSLSCQPDPSAQI